MASVIENKFNALQSTSVGDSNEQLFFDAGDYYKTLLFDIKQAKTSIILETYIFKYDQLGRLFVTALLNALRRGVNIRILVDGVGSFRDAAVIAQKLESENCQFRIFHPLPWDFAGYRRALNAGRWYSQVLHFIGAINHRDHRKLCIIDDHIAWLGSYNITADHFNNRLDITEDNWHDTGLRVSGPIVTELINNFEEVWQRKISPASQRTRNFLSNNSIHTRRRRNRRLLGIIKVAKKRIWVCNAYFNPSYKILSGLKKAAKKGIDVRVLVPSRSDVFWFPFLTRTYYADLLSAGIKVFEYCNRTLHSKTMQIDDEVIIGSTNLNYRSFFHDLELDALLVNPQSVRCMHDRFISDLKFSSEITLKSGHKYHWLMRMFGWCSRFFRYWL